MVRMARNGSGLLIDGLIAWSVDTIFGMPGDGINGVMEAIRERESAIRFIPVRNLVRPGPDASFPEP